MIDVNLASRIARCDELKTARVFTEMGYLVQEISRTRAYRSPDLLVSDAAGPVCLVEIKTILSNGSDPDDRVLLSTLDPEMWNKKMRKAEVTPRQANARFSEAAMQYRSAIACRPEWRGLPFIVALFYDLAGPGISVTQDGMAGFPEISAAVREAQDWDFLDAYFAEPIEKREQMDRAGNYEGLPKKRHRWRILLNPNTTAPLPASFVDRCLPSPRTQGVNELGIAG